MHLKCKMTQDHVDRGVKRNCGKCPGALCVQDAVAAVQLPGLEASLRVVVALFDIYFYEVESTRLFASTKTPKVLRDFILAFDDGKTPAPCEPFDLYPVMSKKAA